MGADTAQVVELVSEVHRAFRDAARPPDDNILPSTSVSDEAQEVGDLFSEYQWQDVPRASLGNNADSIAFMTPEAFVYYLPRYLVEAVEHPREPGSAIVEDLVSHLTPMASSTFVADRLSLMTGEQKRVVAKVLSHVASNAEPFVARRAAEALSTLWGTFRTNPLPG